MKLIVPITTFSSAGNQLKGLLERPQHRENVSLIATTGTYNGYKAIIVGHETFNHVLHIVSRRR